MMRHFTSLGGLALLQVVACRSPEVEGDVPAECSDGVDNDQDGRRDCDDDSCSLAEDCEKREEPEDTGEAPPIDADGDGSPEGEDCDDNDPLRSPDFTEIRYDGVDQDCDPATLDDDIDQDGAPGELDCDDRDSDRFPDNPERPYDGVDQDCDPETPDDDLDGDGTGIDEDCDDADPGRFPSNPEVVWDGVDQDCSDLSPDDDLDGDGLGVAEDCDEGDPSIGASDWRWCLGLGAVNDGVQGDVRGQDLGTNAIFPGDVDGDGLVDLVVGAPGAEGDAGALFVLDANMAIGGIAASAASLVLVGDTAGDRLGEAATLVSVPGSSLILAGLPTDDPGGFANAGVALLLDGRGASGIVPVRSRAILEIQGRATSDKLGSRVFAADTTGDGIAEIFVQSWGDDQLTANSGALAIFDGSLHSAGMVSVEDADLLLSGQFGERMGLGAFSMLGDLDGDGREEFGLGSPESSSTGRSMPGTLHIFDPSSMSSGALLGQARALLVGEQEGDLFGSTATSPGDLDADGRAELFVSALRGDGALTNEGAVYLYRGLDSGVHLAETADLRWTSGTGLGRLGASLVAVDADGLPGGDVLISEPYGEGSSRAWILAGDEFAVWGGGELSGDAYGRISAPAPNAPAEQWGFDTTNGQFWAGLPTSTPGGLREAGLLQLFTP